MMLHGHDGCCTFTLIKQGLLHPSPSLLQGATGHAWRGSVLCNEAAPVQVESPGLGDWDSGPVMTGGITT